MELGMETKTCSVKPEDSVSNDGEHSPLLEVINSSEVQFQAQPILEATIPEPGNDLNSMARSCAVCCIMIISVLIYPAILGLAFSLTSSVDKTPDFRPTFHVGSVSVSLLNLSECQISSNWNISLTVNNPIHGLPMFYDAIRILVLYQNEYYLSTGNVESFYLSGGQEPMVQAWIRGSSVNVEKWVASAVQTDMTTRREMDVALIIDGLVTVNPGLEPKYGSRLSVKVSCKDLKLELS